MSEYLPAFIVEPVLRQARRLSRLSSGEESPGFLPTVPDLQRWNPTRLWNTSPPPSIDEVEGKETAVQSIARTIQLWTNQINNLDLDPIPSPPIEAMEELRLSPPQITQHDDSSVTEFPPLEPQPQEQPRPATLEQLRTSSETSVNPAQELQHRSRTLEDVTRGHSQSDPLAAAVRSGQSTEATRHDSQPTNHFSTDGYVRRRDGSDTLPEDDGMGPLRQRISAVWAGPGTAGEKSRLVHTLMMERYRSTQHPPNVLHAALGSVALPDRTDSPMSIFSGASQEVVFNLTETDLTPTYAPLDPDDQPNDGHNDNAEGPKSHLGCIHYRRNVKLQCATCERWYTCRLCHDAVEDHTLPRRETRHMLCMLCNTPQQASQLCKMCNVQAACYYCGICKLWNNDPEKSIYHCEDCGICRLGEGLGKDFFHCNTCAACMSIQAESTHKCIERSTKCDCPICGEYMFTSNKPVAFMRCGHSIHESCFGEWCNTSYKCPICSKSIANMESQFRRLDRHIDEQPMPEEYRDNRAYIFCNDCNSRSITPYHWLGLKCSLCESYNTTQLELLGADRAPQIPQPEERAQEYALGEAGMTASQSHTPTEELTSPAGSALNMTQIHPVLERPPSVGSPRYLPTSPTTRSVRSVSPVVGSYFGTGRQIEVPRRGVTPLEDDDDLDFWGRQSPPIPGAVNIVPPVADSDESSSGEDDDDDDDDADEDGMKDDDAEDDDDEDVMDIFGHR